MGNPLRVHGDFWAVFLPKKGKHFLFPNLNNWKCLKTPPFLSKHQRFQGDKLAKKTQGVDCKQNTPTLIRYSQFCSSQVGSPDFFHHLDLFKAIFYLLPWYIIIFHQIFWNFFQASFPAKSDIINVNHWWFPSFFLLRLQRQPLHLAALEGHGELVDFLVENQAVPWNKGSLVVLFGKSGRGWHPNYFINGWNKIRIPNLNPPGFHGDFRVFLTLV